MINYLEKQIYQDSEFISIISDIINNSENYNIFEKDKYTSEISSALTKIIEENDERFNNKDIKNNN